MPVPSIESVNSTSASNIGDLLQEGDFQKGTKITAFVFLMLLSMLGNALLIAVVYKNANQRMRTPSNYFIFNMAFADVLLTVYTVPVSSQMQAQIRDPIISICRSKELRRKSLEKSEAFTLRL